MPKLYHIPRWKLSTPLYREESALIDVLRQYGGQPVKYWTVINRLTRTEGSPFFLGRNRKGYFESAQKMIRTLWRMMEEGKVVVDQKTRTCRVNENFFKSEIGGI